MIKNYNRRKLSVTSSHRRSMLRNLASSLILHEKIQTTLSRAKELTSYCDKLITAARGLDINAKRAVSGEIKDKEIVKKIFEVLVPRYQDRKGGYTRILHAGTRVGDRAQMAVVKMVS